MVGRMLSQQVVAGVLIAAAQTAAQSNPGMGADDPAYMAEDRLQHMMTDPPGGLLMEADHMESLGVSSHRFPTPTGRFPVVDHPVHLDPLFGTDPAQPVADLVDELRKKISNPLSLSWEPMAVWTYQHATKVRPGAPHAKSLLWTAVASTWTLWQSHGDYGQVSCLLQNNVGVGTPLEPYMGPSVGNPAIVNNILVGPGASVQLYWQQSFLEDRVRLRIGKISDASFFDRNAVAYDPVNGFMALDFNQSLTNPFPSRGAGLALSADLSDNLTIRGGTLNSASAGDTSGFDGLALSHLFTICELDMRIFPEVNGRMREGHVRLMGWYNAIENPLGEGNIGGPGVTFNMDQAVADHATVFARVGWGSQDVTVSNFAASCGFAVSSPFGLKSCQTGLALEYARITPYGRASAGFFEPPGPPGTPLPRGGPWMLEQDWRIRATESTDTGPVVQVVRDQGVGIDTSIIWGWRTSINF